MPDIFLSYSREDQATARRYAEAFKAEGFDVWWDATLRSGEAYDQVTEKALREAKAVVVLWSKTSVDSRWVRAEATQAFRNKTLVPAMIEPCERPIMFELTQTAELAHWHGDAKDEIWKAFIADVRGFVERERPATQQGAAAPTTNFVTAAPTPKKPQDANKTSICVLPFVNMSDDPQQEYFSDGISEDIITDLSKVSALGVVARNTAFQFKGKNIDIGQIAKQLGVTHILEGSVRKAAARVRITAQLIDTTSGEHVWAERFDRNLDDIFALQDEISKAIVKALRVKLAPEEKKAIETRGTNNAEAYNLYLMARQNYVLGNEGYSTRADAIVRLCKRATEIDPYYAHAWALMALGQMILFYTHGIKKDDGLNAVDRALALAPDLAEAHAIKARILSDRGHTDEAAAEIGVALRLDPDSYEVNKSAARLNFRLRILDQAAIYFEKATTLMETDFNSPMMLLSCYRALARADDLRRASKVALIRAEKALLQDPNNGAAMGAGVEAIAAQGDAVRAKDWMNRALLIDPDNLNMRYNFACTLITQLRDFEMALDMLGPVFARWNSGFLKHAKADPDLDPIRDDARYQAMLAAAEARVAKETGPDA